MERKNNQMKSMEYSEKNYLSTSELFHFSPGPILIPLGNGQTALK